MVSVCWAAFSCYGSVTHFGLYYYQRSSNVRGRREDEMEQKDLKRLSRADLLEMLVDQSAELQRMQMKYEAAQRALEQRTILMDNAGSIAEAALQLNGVFEAAQASAQQYIDSVEALAQRKEDEAEQKRIDNMIKNVQWRCIKMEQETRLRCSQMLERAKVESQSYWDEVQDRLDAYYSQRNPSFGQRLSQMIFKKK